MLLVLLATLCACSRIGGTRDAQTLNVGTAIEPNSFNPLLTTESIEGDLNRLVFNGLTELNERNELVPDLAVAVPTQANGGISRDGTAITYRLRPGVRWQDGAPFTSADVKFTWQAIENPRNNTGNRIPYDEVERVDTPDPLTVVFHLKRVYAPFVAEAFSSATIASILPAHLLARYRDLNHVPFNTAPVGTGPYRLVSWAHGDRIVFAANRAYFKGAPKIASIVVHEIPQENTGINELRSHEIQWYPYLSEASSNMLEGIAGVKVVVTPINAYRGIWINTTAPLLADVRVRQAIAYAIDKRTMVAKVVHGFGRVATEDINPIMWGYDPNVRRYDYDPKRARRLLAQAGWKSGDRLTLAVRQGAVGDEAMAVMIQSYLRAVGMSVSIKSYPGSMLFALGPSGVLDPGKYDLDISGFTESADPDNSPQFACAARPPGGINWTRYCTPEMDKLQREALGTYDRAKRMRAYAQIQALLAQDVPQIPIYYQSQLSAIDDRLQHFAPNMITTTWNVEQWSLSP